MNFSNQLAAGEMDKKAVYGLPLNPRHLLEELAGASFCVSYATRDKLGSQLDDAIRLVGENGILLVDNGAFSLHKQGVSARDESYVAGYEAWAQAILDRCPQAIAVIPDIIGGSQVENAQLINETALDYDRSMPIWHMHESIAYLLHLCEGFGYVGIGSSGEYWQVGSPKWHARIAEAFAAIDRWEAESNGAFIRPRLHMMRAQSQAHAYAFDSSDSTNVAMNHGRYRAEGDGHVARLAARASSRIVASSGAEAEHQAKRPLLDHLEMAAWRNTKAAELAAELAARTPATRRVVVYKNLRRGDWSIAACNGTGPGKVIDHRNDVVLANVAFVVREKARQRVVAKHCREVHAWAIGELVDAAAADLAAAAITYNPYRGATFVVRGTEAPIAGAELVHFTATEGAIALGAIT